ncbi:aldo/keto reductase [Microlunatus capsulatus]|uniref:Aryl-alcohol dehydrogenase-like predicted oxidoreductase n=1 Tax=Microlunatus capsulatus TaxID=99117 RepID=A0ABS4Z415_9ACTN|nr:aldo/keto reductase [Microlunatus capsulatus]MBP2415780.1 aryl-alcohol dehydrogenase-like predicted oxidoreductase [Microlunatus capsulatus]
MTETSFPDATVALGPFAVHRLGFGAMQLPGPGVMGPPRDHDEAVAVLRRAVELGVDHIDTAQYYGPDVANELIREALHPYPEGLALVSKVGAVRDAKGGWPPAQQPAELRAGVEDNLRSLGVEQLAAVNLRVLDPMRGYTPPPFEDQLAEMVALRDEGKIAGIGVSNVDLDQLDTAIRLAGVVCVQNAYSLLDRSSEPVLQRCEAEGIAFVPFFPLGSAFPGTPKVTENAAVVELADQLGATEAQVGLSWLLHHSPVILLIPGTKSLAHLEENMATLTLPLTEDQVADLEKAV